MAEHDVPNRITGPIDMAVKRLAEQSAHLAEALVGPQPRERAQPQVEPTFSLEPFLRETELETLENPITPRPTFPGEEPVAQPETAPRSTAPSQSSAAPVQNDPLSQLESLVKDISSRQL